MILRLSAINKQQELRQFSCTLPELESGFELLNKVINLGDRLLSAELIDDGHKPTPLPVEAFDGISFLPILNQLELDWKAVLAKPLRTYSGLDTQDRNWYRQQLCFCEQGIIHLELLISGLSRLCQRAEDTQTLRDERFISYSQSVLSCYETQLTKTYVIRNLLLDGFQVV